MERKCCFDQCQLREQSCIVFSIDNSAFYSLHNTGFGILYDHQVIIPEPVF